MQTDRCLTSKFAAPLLALPRATGAERNFSTAQAVQALYLTLLPLPRYRHSKQTIRAKGGHKRSKVPAQRHLFTPTQPPISSRRIVLWSYWSQFTGAVSMQLWLIPSVVQASVHSPILPFPSLFSFSLFLLLIQHQYALQEKGVKLSRRGQ